MSRAGYGIIDSARDADVLIVNSCAFLAAAIEETLDVVWDLRDANERAVLVLTGCLPLREGRALIEELPEVDIFLEPALIPQLPAIIETRKAQTGRRVKKTRKEPLPPDYHCGGVFSPELFDVPRTLTTSGYAYLKIAEGCDRRCRYCAIPAIRGPLRSFDETFLVDEARALIDLGAKEIVITAQDVTAYGKDCGRPDALPHLLRRIGGLPGLKRLRLMYLHPAGITDELVRTVNETETILPYMDIPFQHVADKTLKSMGRPTKGDDLRRLVDRLREEIPGLCLRTTFMVGYPTEDDREFRQLLSFVKQFTIEHAGVFMYSPEHNTPAAPLGDPVPREVKLDRFTRLAEILDHQADTRNKKRIGRVEQCLVEGPSEETDLLLHARTWDQAPDDLDGMVYICDGTAVQGDLNPVLITEAHEHDLFGEIVSECSVF
jgi:ribosomal protein S12 methylthiotransferase